MTKSKKQRIPIEEKNNRAVSGLSIYPGIPD
jgi:hypothetical protein